MDANALDDFADRWNPILVKELRQALRSRGFSILFVTAQVIAAGIAAVILLQQGAGSGGGTALFASLSFCLVIATVVVVPVFAFQSFSQEWEENTLDLLVLSQIQPVRIALGKLQGAMLQASLIAISFAPYLAVCLLLEGVDLLLPFVLLFGSVAASSAVSCLAMAIAGLGRTRALRSALLGLFTLALVFAGTAGVGLMQALVLAPAAMRSAETAAFAGFVALLALFAAGLCLLGSSAHLAHPEEAPTLAARILALLGAVVLPFGLYAAGLGSGFDRDVSPALASVFLLVLAPAALFFATERESMGRVLSHRLRARPLQRLLAFPLWPGGGRGVVLAVLLFAASGLSAAAGNAVFGKHTIVGSDVDWDFYLALCLYALLYTVPVSLLTLWLGDKILWRWVARSLAPLLLFAGVLGGAAAGYVLGIRDWERGEHLLNPFFVLSDGPDRDHIQGLLILVGILLAVQTLRYLKGRARRAPTISTAKPAASVER